MGHDLLFPFQHGKGMCLDLFRTRSETFQELLDRRRALFPDGFGIFQRFNGFKEVIDQVYHGGHAGLGIYQGLANISNLLGFPLFENVKEELRPLLGELRRP